MSKIERKVLLKQKGQRINPGPYKLLKYSTIKVTNLCPVFRTFKKMSKRTFETLVGSGLVFENGCLDAKFDGCLSGKRKIKAEASAFRSLINHQANLRF